MPGTNAVLDYQAQLLFTAGLLQTGARVVVTSDDLTVQDSDYTLVVQRSPAGPSTIALPAASGLSTIPGSRFLRIFDGTGDAATNNITITGTGALINGAASIVINQNWGSAALEWMGTYWYWHQGASSSGSLTAHAPTHRAGGTDDLLSAPGPIGATPSTVGATNLILTTAATPTAVSGKVKAYAISGQAAGLQFDTSDLLSEKNASTSGTAHVRRWFGAVTLADQAFVDIAITKGGHGTVTTVGPTAATGGSFSFADNAATSLNGLTFTTLDAADTPTKLCVFASGGALRIRNRIGGQTTVLIDLTEAVAS